MCSHLSRRSFLSAGLGTGAVLGGIGDLGFINALGPVRADEATLSPDRVRLGPDVEPIVRLIEETPRERLIEEVAARIKSGLSYQDLLAALMLAGVLNIEPRPSVGFKFHAVLVVNSAHLASLASPDEHRWMPIFWALDYYKVAARRDVEERGDWTMSPVSDSSLPPAHQAGKEFISAMDRWDESAADAATASLARTSSMNDVYEMMFRYGARDFRSIGHKAIYVANSLRTLQCIGWRHAEPILRSLTYALLMHEGGNPAEREAEADLPWRRNLEKVGSVRADWQHGKVDSGATEELLQTLRTASNEESCDAVIEMLNGGIAPQSVWDALHVMGGEYLMQQTGIVALHAVTTTNALRYAYETSGNNETRLMMLLQNAAFLPMFRQAMNSRGRVRDVSVAMLREAPEEKAASLDELFAQLHSEPLEAARRAMPLLREGGAEPLVDAARALVFLKGNDAHDYKFSSAVLEDYAYVSSEWRDTYLAANLVNLHSTEERDNPLVERTRAALA